MLIIAYAHYIGMAHSHSWKLGHYIADNVDHSVRTLYRYGTFHCMSIILATTPGIKQKLVVHKGQSSETNFLVKKFLLNITDRVLGKMLPNVTKNYPRSMHMMNVRTLTHYGKYIGRYVVRYYEKTTQDQCILYMMNVRTLTHYGKYLGRYTWSGIRKKLLKINAYDECAHIDTLWKISWSLRGPVL